MNLEGNFNRMIKGSFLLILLVVFIEVISYILEKTHLTLTHLGSGTLKTGPTEEIIFEFARAEPFTISGYVNLRNMEEGDIMVLKVYVKLAVDGEYVLYAEQTYVGKQEQPLVRIRELPAMKGVKITLRQTSGTPKYVPWEFYGRFVS